MVSFLGGLPWGLSPAVRILVSQQKLTLWVLADSSLTWFSGWFWAKGSF